MALSSALASRLLGAALFAVAAGIYAPTLAHGYVSLDDPGYVENRLVRAGLTWEGVAWAFTNEHSSNWHPLTWLSHMADVELFGSGPAGPHLVNALLHGAATLLLFLFLRAGTGAVAPSALTALFFALHPLRVESVAWVAERKDLLAGVFFFLVLLAYLRYARRPSLARYALVSACLALGLMAKPMLVTLPGVLLLLDLWPLRRWRPGEPAPAFGRLVLEKAPLLLMSAASCAVTLWAQARGHALRDLESHPLVARLSNAVESTVMYVSKSVWPLDLCVYYPYPSAAVSCRPATFAALALLLAAVVGAALCARSRPWFTVGVAWFLGMLVPVIGIVQVGSQRMADRYAYLPQVGLLIALVFGPYQAFRSPHARRALGAAALVLALLCGVLTLRQQATWKDSVTLLEHALEVESGSAFVHGNLGLVYLEQGDHSRAIEHLRARITLAPSAAMLVNLGVAQARAGDARGAAASFEHALRLNPALFDAHANLGALLLARGDARGALEHLERADELRPGSTAIQTNLEAARAALAAGSRGR